MRALKDGAYFCESFRSNHHDNFRLPRRALKNGLKNAEGGGVSSGCSNADTPYVITGIDAHRALGDRLCTARSSLTRATRLRSRRAEPISACRAR